MNIVIKALTNVLQMSNSVYFYKVLLLFYVPCFDDNDNIPHTTHDKHFFRGIKVNNTVKVHRVFCLSTVVTAHSYSMCLI